MRAKLAMAAVAVLAVAGLIVWKYRERDAHSERPASSAKRSASPRGPGGAPLQRGSIAGTVTDEQKRPVAGARVCARGWSSDLGTVPFRDPVCTTADARGAYTIDGLLPARYAVTAFARPYRPARQANAGGVALAEGARLTGIAIVLRGQGVELTGTVADVTAGPIAHARVTATSSSSLVDAETVTVEADDQGRYSLWVAPGAQHLIASADGYADGRASADAPGTAAILLTPEATIEGVVLDAITGAPIENARVGITRFDWRDDVDQVVTSDARGAFRFDRLVFDRFSIIARADHRYGRSAGSLRLGLGQHQAGVVIRMYPAQDVAGTVSIAPSGRPCAAAYGSLRDDANDRSLVLERAGDALVARGVPPGTYVPRISCVGFVDRATYDPIKVADRDVTGIVWHVEEGATLRGKVVTRGGAPVGGAMIYNERAGRLVDKTTRSRDDGSYELAGLASGPHQVKVRTDKAIVDRDDTFVLAIDAPGTFDHDFVLGEAGAIEGTTVDADGRPVPDADVVIADDTRSTSARSNEAGVFSVRGLRPGDYRVDASGTSHAVRANQVTNVKVVVAAKRSAITGKVVDAQGAPVSDALVVAVSEIRYEGFARSATRWLADVRPVLTAPDGTFALTRLAADPHVVRAYRRGGGEAIAEHVQAGTSVTLQLADNGTIAGTATDRSGALGELVVQVVDDTASLMRTERFFGTQGSYSVGDLPEGRYTVTWDAASGWKRAEVSLEPGEFKRVDIELDPLVTVTGRVVDLRAHTPVGAIKVTAYATDSRSFAGTATSDGAGRFRMVRVTPGQLEFRLAGNASHPGATALRSVERTTGTVDVGDLPMVEARATGDDPAGELGFELDDSPETIARRECVVGQIDPTGPAARAGLREGDVIVGVDGIDLRGDGYGHWDAAVTAPAGTKLVFDLARGGTVRVVLARPRD